MLNRTVARLELGRQNAALRHQLEAERSRAAKVRTDLLPKEAPEIEAFDLAARMVPARETGGDFYDWTETEGGDLSLALGDAAGKGIPAALLAATARAVVRGVSRQNAPVTTMNLAARAVEDDMRSSRSVATLFHARLDPRRRRLLYVNAGHGHVFVRRTDGKTEKLATAGAPLGTTAGETYRESSLDSEPGDALVAYSDGFSDARLGQLGPDGMVDSLQMAMNATETVDLLVDPDRLEEPPRDDLAVLVLRCRDEARSA